MQDKNGRWGPYLFPKNCKKGGSQKNKRIQSIFSRKLAKIQPRNNQGYNQRCQPLRFYHPPHLAGKKFLISIPVSIVKKVIYQKVNRTEKQHYSKPKCPK